MCGPPASGKSHVARGYVKEHGYVWINQDTLKSKAKCLKTAREALHKGKSVVIDATNRNQKTRSKWIALAGASGVRIVCWEMQIDRILADHMNWTREAITDGTRRRVPPVALGSFFKNYEKPEMTEGFAAVVAIPFIPNFSDEKARQHFCERA